MLTLVSFPHGTNATTSHTSTLPPQTSPSSCTLSHSVSVSPDSAASPPSAGRVSHYVCSNIRSRCADFPTVANGTVRLVKTSTQPN